MNALDLLQVKDVSIHSNVESVVSVVPFNQDMIPALTKLHLATFAGYMNARMGKTYIGAFLNWFRCVENGIALAAIGKNYQPLGYVVGAPVGYAQAMNHDLFGVGCRAMMKRPWLYLDSGVRKKILERVKNALGYSAPSHPAPSIPEPTMSLVSLAVLPSARRQKIGNHLLRALEERAYQMRMCSLRLSVYPNNLDARRFYEKCGWQSFVGPPRDTGEIYYYRILDNEIDCSCLPSES